MLHLAKGQAMRHITDRLDELGYNWAYRVINTEGFGLPQRRARVYIVASRKHDPRNVVLADDFGRNPNDNFGATDVPLGFYWTEGQYATGMNFNGVPPLKGGSTIGIPSPPAILYPDGLVGTPDIRDAERLQGLTADWTKPAEQVGRASHRWKLVGNAVSVPVAEWVGKRLLNPGQYDPSGDEELSGRKWPGAVWSVDGVRCVSQVSEYPLRCKYQGLDTFLRFPTKPLSAKAARGYLRRARRGNLRHPPGFIERLDSHAERMKS
jgi:DNA (cytosine-5)-methyltransferase 1